MKIIIEVTEEQLAVINKKTPTEQFEKELVAYADGLVKFYVSEGDKIQLEAETEIDIKRLAALKADEAILTTVDEIIRTKVVEVKPIEVEPIVKPIEAEVLR